MEDAAPFLSKNYGFEILYWEYHKNIEKYEETCRKVLHVNTFYDGKVPFTNLADLCRIHSNFLENEGIFD